MEKKRHLSQNSKVCPLGSQRTTTRNDFAKIKKWDMGDFYKQETSLRTNEGKMMVIFMKTIDDKIIKQ